jgi:hypothetical protein
MSDRYEYPQVSAFGAATEDDGHVDLVANPGTVTYVCIEHMNISVYEAAAGGGGVAEIKDTDGDLIYSVNADGVKDIPLEFGEEGLKIGPNKGIQLVVSGAQTKQASVSVALTGHLSTR